jgi:hypothetical protein
MNSLNRYFNIQRSPMKYDQPATRFHRIEGLERRENKGELPAICQRRTLPRRRCDHASAHHVRSPFNGGAITQCFGTAFSRDEPRPDPVLKKSVLEESLTPWGA